VTDIPAAALSAAPMLGLAAIAMAWLVVGWAAFRRRDLALPA
jgi:putative exporter of polyketide antibiotics